MNLANLLLGILIATLYAGLFHIFQGGSISVLVFYISLSWTGFFIGNIMGNIFGINTFMLGGINIGSSTVTAFLFLLAGNWLSQNGNIKR